nr:autotransporter outer membrane beta-barrel domain-containing protein [Sporomusa malonica]
MNSGAALSGTTSLILGTINLSGTSGTYAIANLAVTNGGTVSLANGTTAGNQLNITNMSGGAKFVINTDLAHGQSDQINITSAANSQNTVQVAYDPGFATGKNISGSASFATVSGGSAAFTAAPTEYGAYRFTPTLSETTSGGVDTWSVTGLTVPSDGPAGVSETVHTASDINAGSLMLWRSENNNLTKRMGELRNAKGQEGEWARVYRGSEETVDSYGRSTTSDYTAIQGGYDTKHRVDGGTWYTGYALGYLSGDAALARGSGTYSSVTVGAYGSWLGDKGHYFDVIAKAGRLRTSYYNYLNDAVSTRVDGSYANWGTSVSAEYGFRKKLADNWYLEPQLEINLARVNSASYTTSDGTSAYNQGSNSTVGRLGLAIGRNMDQKNSFYVKTSIAREFSARSAVTMSTGGLTPVTLEQNLKQTWLEYALGLTTAFNSRTNGYMEISKTTGSTTKTPWLVNAGIRWNF